jgi:hypothetical protein
MRPIRDIPVYNASQWRHRNRIQRTGQGRVGLARVPVKQARTARMWWMTSLRARFIHAVKLLGDGN